MLRNGQNGVFCHHSFSVQEQLEMLSPSLLKGNVILQKCPILGLERIIWAWLIDSLCCLEEVVHVMLISKALNHMGFLFPPLVFNISDLLLCLSFDALLYTFCLCWEIMSCQSVSLATKKVLNLHIILIKPVLGAYVRCGRLSRYMYALWIADLIATHCWSTSVSDVVFFSCSFFDVDTW